MSFEPDDLNFLEPTEIKCDSGEAMESSKQKLTGMNYESLITYASLIASKKRHKPEKYLYEDYLGSILSEYTEGCRKLDCPEFSKAELERIVKGLTELNDQILEIHKLYLSGDQSMAFNELAIYFIQLQEVYEGLGLSTATEYIESSSFLDRALTTIDRPLFRWRRRPDSPFPKMDYMLNIPVFERHKIRDVRYGFETRSSLYLGSSSYVCWKEMDELEVDKVSACAFEFDSSDLFLDFRMPIRNIGEIVKKGKMAMLEGILKMPFLISTHIKVLFKDSHFKEEYIMTKLFSSYLMLFKDPVKGIIYSSTKIDYHTHHLEDHYSVFIPSNPIGELDLNYRITLTCDLKEILNVGIDTLNKSLPEIRTSGELNIGSTKVDYKKTNWGKIDRYVAHQSLYGKDMFQAFKASKKWQ